MLKKFTYQTSCVSKWLITCFSKYGSQLRQENMGPQKQWLSLVKAMTPQDSYATRRSCEQMIPPVEQDIQGLQEEGVQPKA